MATLPESVEGLTNLRTKSRWKPGWLYATLIDTLWYWYSAMSDCKRRRGYAAQSRGRSEDDDYI